MDAIASRSAGAGGGLSFELSGLGFSRLLILLANLASCCFATGTYDVPATRDSFPGTVRTQKPSLFLTTIVQQNFQSLDVLFRSKIHGGTSGLVSYGQIGSAALQHAAKNG